MRWRSGTLLAELEDRSHRKCVSHSAGKYSGAPAGQLQKSWSTNFHGCWNSWSTKKTAAQPLEAALLNKFMPNSRPPERLPQATRANQAQSGACCADRMEESHFSGHKKSARGLVIAALGKQCEPPNWAAKRRAVSSWGKDIWMALLMRTGRPWTDLWEPMIYWSFGLLRDRSFGLWELFFVKKARSASVQTVHPPCTWIPAQICIVHTTAGIASSSIKMASTKWQSEGQLAHRPNSEALVNNWNQLGWFLGYIDVMSMLWVKVKAC